MIGHCDNSVEVLHEGSLGRKRSCKNDRRSNRNEEELDQREPLHEANHQPHSNQQQQTSQTRNRREMSPLRARGAHDFAPFPKRVSPSRGSSVSATSTAPPTTTAYQSDRDSERERRRERMQRHRRPPRRPRPRAPSKENHPAPHHNEYGHYEALTSSFECGYTYTDEATYNERVQYIGNGSINEPIRNNLFSELRHGEADDPTESIHLRDSNDHFDRFNIAEPSEIDLESVKIDTVYDLHPVTSKILNRKYDRDRSPSPLPKPISPNKAPHIDLKTLHEQLGPTEPVRSMPTKLMAFPWRPDTEEIMEPLIKSRYMSSKNHHIDSYRPESIVGNMAIVFNKVCKREPKRIDNEDQKDGAILSDFIQDEKIEKISKKIQTLKRKLIKYESEFEQTNGFRISQADKMNHPVLNNIYSELHYLKLDKKRIQSVGAESVFLERRKPVKEIWDDCDISFAGNKSMAELVVDIEKWVDRCATTNTSGVSGIAAEKAALQVALLRLEAARGRPGRAGPERPVARPLYDRYRALKRMLKSEERNENPLTSSAVGELETIMEHEALLLTATSIDSSSDSQEKQSDDTEEKDEEKEENKLIQSGTESEEALSSAKSTTSEEIQPLESQASSSYTNEGLHCLPYGELSRLLADARVQKANLRALIRTNEIEFEIKNGRKLLKDERPDIEQDYVKYKEVKARIRLLTALVNKHKKMVVDQ